MCLQSSHGASVVSTHNSVTHVPSLAPLVACGCPRDVFLELLRTVLRGQPPASTYTAVFFQKGEKKQSFHISFFFFSGITFNSAPSHP